MVQKISIIVAVYNVEKYIQKCLISLAQQHYEHIEVICVDDGSTDQSGMICEEFCKSDSRFTVIHQKNQGAAAARNAALERASGEYIGIVDGDDWIEPKMYECFLKRMVEEDLDIVSGGYFYDYDNRQVMLKNKKKVPEKPIKGEDFLYYIFNRDEYKGVGGYHCTRLIKREIIENNSIRYDTGFKSCQDIIFLTRCYLAAQRTMFIDHNFYHYRQREDSLYHNPKTRIEGLWTVKAYEEIINLLRKEKVNKKIVDYARRFRIYHASEIYRMAKRMNDVSKTDELKKLIKEDILIYAKMNWKKPQRVVDLYKLIK